jgi:hypothetical protein
MAVVTRHPEHPVVTRMRRQRAADQNRAAEFQQAKADHDFVEQETELKTNTQLTREIHVLTTELHRRVIDGG